jgi:hypothetical protein
MTTSRRSTPTDPRELLLALEVPPLTQEAWGAALALYYFDRHEPLPEGVEEHLRQLLDEWHEEAKAAGW